MWFFIWLMATWQWSEQAIWRSWLIHTIGALVIAVFFGGRVAGVFFNLRELEQLFHAAKVGKFEKWWDYPMDTVGPNAIWYLWPFEGVLM